MQYSIVQSNIEHYYKDNRKRDNSRSSEPNSKTDNTTNVVMNFLGAIVKISKALDKAQEKPPDLKTLLRSLV